MSIKRFKEEGVGQSNMEQCSLGGWVDYEDHAAEVARLNEQLSRYSVSAGQADQRVNESKAVRVALGFGVDAEDVAPCDLVEAIARLNEQVQSLVEFKNKVRQLFKMGELAEDFAVFVNIENALRRSRCLDAVEREFFTSEVPDEDYPDEMCEECNLFWGKNPDEYVADFSGELNEVRAQAVERVAASEEFSMWVQQGLRAWANRFRNDVEGEYATPIRAGEVQP